MVTSSLKIMDKMEKVRAAKKPPAYKNVCDYVKSLPDDHAASLKEVKKWEKHNRDVIKELKHLWRRTEKGKEKDNLQREIWNREGYLRRIVTYFETGVWLDLFWGPDMENRVAYRTKARAYDNDGYLKINYDSDERL